MAKSVANYANAQLIKMEAMADGYAEGIALDTNGNVSEGSGANIFVVRDGVIFTPPIGNSVLAGITRDSVMTLAQGPRASRCASRRSRARCSTSPTRCSSCGTAAEVTPIRSVDRVKVGRGRRGPITQALQERFFQIVTGQAEDKWGWLQYLNTPTAAAAR